jgi:serine acetyltransferase
MSNQHSSMHQKSLFVRIMNRILHLIARFAPGATTLRPLLHKKRGVIIRGRVFIGEEVYLENEHPECIEIDEEAQIALRTTLVAHFRGTGKIRIGKMAWIGSGCTIAAGPNQVLSIGEASVIGAGSVVTKDVPPYTFVAGVPAKLIARVTVPMTMETDMDVFRAGLRPLNRSE